MHTHLVHADLYGQLAAAVTRRTGVSSVHATPDFYLRNPYRTAGRAVGRMCKRRIAISEHVARFVRDQHLAPPDRIRTVRYGMDASGFARTEEERAAARVALELTPDEVVVGVASRLIVGKGHDVLIDAFGDAAQTRPDLRLLVAGVGELRSSLEARAASAVSAGQRPVPRLRRADRRVHGRLRRARVPDATRVR